MTCLRVSVQVISHKRVVNRVSEYLEEKNHGLLLSKSVMRLLQEKNKAIANDQPLVRSYVISRTCRGQSSQKSPNCGVVVSGDPDLLVHLARIAAILLQVTILAGFITRGRGSVHRANCTLGTYLNDQAYHSCFLGTPASPGLG